MKKALIVFIAVLSVTLSFMRAAPFCAAAEGDTPGVLPSGLTDSEAGDAIDEYLAKNQSNRAAVATAVFRGEDDIYTRYFGDIDLSGTPLDENCVLEWGSTTKLIVWVSAMQLAEAGKLDLNADIRRYLPEGFLKNLNFDGDITMLNLMNHNAGFEETDFILEAETPDGIIPLGEYLAKYQPNQVFAPGSVTAYSNWGAALAGYIVERISEKPFWQYVRDNIFIPLGMEHSATASDLSDNEWVREKRSAFISVYPDGSIEPENKVYIIPYPAGMCVSTLSDFVIFAKALLTKDARLLKSESYELMYSPSSLYTGTEKTRSAHGFLVDYDFASTVIGHDGNTAGGSSRLILDLQNNVGMVMLTNQLGGSMYRNGMSEIVFGTSDNNAEIDGYYIPARNVFSGRHKMIYNLFFVERCHITSVLTKGLYVNVLPDRLEISMTDYLRQPAFRGDTNASDLLPDYRLNDTLAVIWFVALGYGAVNAAVRIIIAMVFKRKKRKTPRLNLISCIFGLLPALCILPVNLPIPALAAAVYTVLLGAAYAALCVYLVRVAATACKTKLGVVSYCQTWSLILIYAITLINVIVWEIAF